MRHTRLAPFRRTFRHRSYLWLVDLDRLPELPRWLTPFACFDARDHCGDPDRGIRSNVDSYLAEHGVDLAGGRVVMLAGARVLGYVFNPLSVYWCHRRGGELACVIAEVHNTYRQRHRYLLRPNVIDGDSVAKEFYVSPFFDVAGHYRMRLPEPDERLALGVTLHQGGRPVFVATLHGTRRRVAPAELTRLLLRHPLAPQHLSAAIRRHGITLWLRGLPVISREASRARERGTADDDDL